MKLFIFIDKRKLMRGELDAGKIIGSITQLQRQNIEVDGVVLTYHKLYKLLGRAKYYNDQNYYIRRREIERSKHKK